MLKQKNVNKTIKQQTTSRSNVVANNRQELVIQLGACAFTALTLIGATETILHHMAALNPAGGHGSTSISELFARGEGKNESARMPEEFDIGLQTPHVSGL